MNSHFPNWKEYEQLYHRYVWSSDPAKLIDVAVQSRGGQYRHEKCLAGKRVLDLAAGTGRLAREALDLGAAFVMWVDESISMLKPSNLGAKNFEELRSLENADFYAGPVECFFMLTGGKYDYAFSQQAIANWLSEHAVDRLAETLVDGGVFVFDAYITKPPLVPKVKEYVEAGRHYVEAVWLTREDDVEWVNHIQICEGLPPHSNHFRWIPPDEYDTMLSKRFNVERLREGRIDYYRCVKF